MKVSEAIELLAPGEVGALGPTTWADLGCGAGTFTRALASLLAPGSTVHAIDRDASALQALPSVHGPTAIRAYAGDFTRRPWPFPDVDGILMANSLHYVDDQPAFLRACESHMTSRRNFLIVEYDTSEPSRWVPYPVNQSRLTTLFERAGYTSVRVLRSRPSIYRRAPIYSVAIRP